MNLIQLRLQLAEPVELHVELLADFVKLILDERQYFGGLHLRPRRACRPCGPLFAVCAVCPAHATFTGLPLRSAIVASAAHERGDYHTGIVNPRNKLNEPSAQFREDFADRQAKIRLNLEVLAPRAYRRPVTKREIDELMKFAALSADLQILAIQQDVTRVSTFMLGVEQSRRTYTEIGIPEEHHGLTHHAGNEEKIAKVCKIDW